MRHISFAHELSLLKLAHATLFWDFPQTNIKKSFALLIYEKMKRMGIPSFLLVEFGKVLFFGNIPDFISDKDLLNAYSVLKKRYKIYKKFNSPRAIYKYLFLLELAYILKLGNIKYDTSLFIELFNKLHINRKQQQVLEEYISLVEAGKTVESSIFLKDNQLKKNMLSIHPLIAFINNEKQYYYLPRCNISVFSTMSAGKSSFINALLGHDYLPSKNEACTAKIASITDIDYIDYCLGYAIKNGEPVFCGTVTQKILEEWNKDSEVTEIGLEGDLDRISSEQTVTVIHDTPGVNYSGNAEHKKVTLTHITESFPNIIICLLDATQMLTTDFSDALFDLKKSNKNNAEIIFVVNKADSFDSKKESLKDCITTARTALKEYGFENPPIVPVSSRAARLFKMALNNRVDFTETEIDDFVHYIRFFSWAENNFSLFAVNVPCEFCKDTGYNTKYTGQIVIEENVYERQQITNALFFTGIPVIEYILNKQEKKK